MDLTVTEEKRVYHSKKGENISLRKYHSMTKGGYKSLRTTGLGEKYRHIMYEDEILSWFHC